MKNINVILFDDFTILDALGPVEVFRCLDKIYTLGFYSMNGGRVRTNPDLGIMTRSADEIQSFDILLVPGGLGTRKLADDPDFISRLKVLAEKSEFVLCVCTGSALLARTGLLKGLRATSNKLAFDWVVQQGPGVNWVRKSRWIADGKYYTSSGVSAGMDMALGFIRDQQGEETAIKICKGLEYVWYKNSEEDPFA
ncbi:MAG: DJ-1/PfpI family protein [bacterium]|nr:DJ-1/PfpI family protein [bacterium]